MEREYKYDHHFCRNCGKRFDCKYYTAEFCQTKCRVAYHRKSNASKKLAKKILADVEKLFDMNCANESVSKDMTRISSLASGIAERWEFVRPL